MITDSFGRYAVETVRDHALDPRSRCSGRLRRSDAHFQGQDGVSQARTRSRTRAGLPVLRAAQALWRSLSGSRRGSRPGRDPGPGRGSRPVLVLPAGATLPVSACASGRGDASGCRRGPRPGPFGKKILD